MKAIYLVAIMLAVGISANISAARTPKPPQDVNVVNTPNVTVMNPQTSVTVNNTAPIPVDVQGGITVSSEPRFVGFSTDTLAGDAGYPAINQACRDSFGAGARICEAKEVIVSIQPPIASASSEAWVVSDTSSYGTQRLGWNDSGWNCDAFKGVGDSLVVSAATGEILYLTTTEILITNRPRLYVLGTCADSRAAACCQ